MQHTLWCRGSRQSLEPATCDQVQAGSLTCHPTSEQNGMRLLEVSRFPNIEWSPFLLTTPPLGLHCRGTGDIAVWIWPIMRRDTLFTNGLNSSLLIFPSFCVSSNSITALRGDTSCVIPRLTEILESTICNSRSSIKPLLSWSPFEKASSVALASSALSSKVARIFAMVSSQNRRFISVSRSSRRLSTNGRNSTSLSLPLTSFLSNKPSITLRSSSVVSLLPTSLAKLCMSAWNSLSSM
mmetsp:Transcript_60475/g.167550  ORF Transcript_60475/g.167550 Transcript_60475/m.167550 type:complete len:239 (-) Transcript_60475:63-779(-)